MKELEYCSECDGKLSYLDKDRNRDWQVEYEDWKCAGCWDWEDK